MPAAFPIRGPVRIDTPNQRLAVALAVSLAIHLIAWGTWHASPVIASAVRNVTTRILAQLNPKLRSLLAEEKKPEAAPSQREVPMVFVEVDPALASAEPPPETKYYSTQNALAANPEPRVSAEVPQIDGTQTKIVRMADNPRPQPKPLQPAPPPDERAEGPEQPEVKPQAPPARPQETVGDLAMTRPAPVVPPPAPGTADTKVEPKTATRPRTLREAAQRNPTLAGRMMRQEGGVQRRARLSMHDVKQSAFGDYDYQFIRAVEERWYQLLDDNQYMLDRQGEVVLEFKLHYDGRITAMNVTKNTVGDILCLLCQKAILDPAPFPKWSAQMRRMVSEDHREVRFTFFYD